MTVPAAKTLTRNYANWQFLSNPYCPSLSLQTHVRSDGSVKLDCIVGTQRRFPQLMQMVHTDLRIDHDRLFPEFVRRAQSHLSLKISDSYDPKDPTKIKIDLRFFEDPLKSNFATALLTDEYRRQVQNMDNPSASLRAVQVVEVQGDVTRLWRSDDVINYRFPRNQDPYLSTLNDLRDAFLNPGEPTELQKKISGFVKQVLSFRVDFEENIEISSQTHALLEPAIDSIKTVFQGMLCMDNEQRATEITNIGFVDKRIIDGRSYFLLTIQLCKQDSPKDEQVKRGVVRLEAIFSTIKAACDNVAKNWKAKEYENVDIGTVRSRSYKRGRMAEFIATTSKMYRAVEPSMMLFGIHRYEVNRDPLFKDLSDAQKRELVEERMLLEKLGERTLESKSTDCKDRT